MSKRNYSADRAVTQDFDDLFAAQPARPLPAQMRVSRHSHFREDISADNMGTEMHGNSRRWGDASQEVQSRAVQAIVYAAEKVGLSTHDTAYLLAIARHESGFNPDAASRRTSASGLGQVINRTGAAYGLNNENRFDINANAAAFVGYFKDMQHVAERRGKSEEYIYKYYHDGPSGNYGGRSIARKEIMPRVDDFEQALRSQGNEFHQAAAAGVYRAAVDCLDDCRTEAEKHALLARVVRKHPELPELATAFAARQQALTVAAGEQTSTPPATLSFRKVSLQDATAYSGFLARRVDDIIATNLAHGRLPDIARSEMLADIAQPYADQGRHI
jgi:hypothetical protein